MIIMIMKNGGETRVRSQESAIRRNNLPVVNDALVENRCIVTRYVFVCHKMVFIKPLIIVSSRVITMEVDSCFPTPPLPPPPTVSTPPPETAGRCYS